MRTEEHTHLPDLPGRSPGEDLAGLPRPRRVDGAQLVSQTQKVHKSAGASPRGALRASRSITEMAGDPRWPPHPT